MGVIASLSQQLIPFASIAAKWSFALSLLEEQHPIGGSIMAVNKTFTISEAQELLPTLRREMRILQPIYRRLKRRWRYLAKVNDVPSDDPFVRDLCLDDDAGRVLLREVEETLSLFQRLGVECKGIEEGLFDFPCLVEDRLVFLCWHIQEGEVSYWHELDCGFFERRPLLEATKACCHLENRLVN
jgi:hypothetical protein